MSTDLIQAVDALVKPEIIVYLKPVTKRVKGRLKQVYHQELPPLLTQLQDAITSATTGNGGGSGAPTAVLVNSAAMYEFSTIASQVRDWYRMVHVCAFPRSRDLVPMLNAWAAAFVGAPDWYTQQLVRWAATIREVVDRPERVPLDGACVVCKAEKYVNKEGASSQPVVVEYWPHEPLRTARAVCRLETCAAVWVGADAIEELIGEMSEQVA